MVPRVLEITSRAGCAHGILRPAKEHRDLGDVEWSRPVLEHRWNMTAVNRWGRLVRSAAFARDRRRTIHYDWGRL